MLRIRDFIETKDGLIFAVVSYTHPEQGYLAYLRYYPESSGDRKRGGVSFKKIGSTRESYEYLEKHFPEYLIEFESENQGYQGSLEYQDSQDSLGSASLQYVPMDRISKIYRPEERLREIIECPKDKIEEKISTLVNTLPVPARKIGITGSILVGLHNENSDIDLVVYGIKNHEKARMALKKVFEDRTCQGEIRPPNRTEWKRAYKKRFPYRSVNLAMNFGEFLWHEKRKFHKGVINGTIFDILLVRDFDEIERTRHEEVSYRRIKKVKKRCRVKDARLAFDSPSIYKVDIGKIKEVVSYTHTYAGQAFEGEEIEVCGYLEEMAGRGLAGRGYYRIVVGTTREAREEYIKHQKILNG